MKTIFKYVRNRKNQLVGCVLAQGNDQGFSIGWSLEHPSDLRRSRGKFDKQRAREIAEIRAGLAKDLNEAPYSIQSEIEVMLNRGLRYFKSPNGLGVGSIL